MTSLDYATAVEIETAAIAVAWTPRLGPVVALERARNAMTSVVLGRASGFHVPLHAATASVLSMRSLGLPRSVRRSLSALAEIAIMRLASDRLRGLR